MLFNVSTVCPCMDALLLNAFLSLVPCCTWLAFARTLISRESLIFTHSPNTLVLAVQPFFLLFSRDDL